VGSTTLLAIPIGAWLFYLLKIVNFNRQALLRQENQFLLALYNLPSSLRWYYVFVAISLQFLPAILYGGFLLTVALQHGIAWIAFIILFILALWSAVGALVLLRELKYPNQDKKVTHLKRFLDRNFAKPLIQFYLEWIVRREPVALFGTKIFSGLMLAAVSYLYRTDFYDARLLAMGSTVAFCGNMAVIFHIHQFENVHFGILRNLPLSFSQRLLNIFTVLLILLLPEIGFLWKGFPAYLPAGDYFTIFFFGLSTVLLSYAYLYRPAVKLENFSQIVFGAIMSWVVLILCKAPLWVLTTLNIVTAMWLFKKYYYDYERPTPENERA
ncbi:MAG: hypothetical protein ACOYXT_26535, partial [Bacteroidota bacterium]